MDYQRYQYLKVDIDDDGVCVVTLNRPDTLNAAGGPMHPELERIWVDINDDPLIKAVVLTGEGRAFSAGGDLKGMAQRVGTHENFLHSLNQPAGTRRLWNNLTDVQVPIVAAINGDATGLGCTLALFCDITVIADTARIGDTHVRVGLEVASAGIQVHGGAGYVEETGAAQHLRDIRVAAIYEGTTGIQAADLVSRKILRMPGPALLAELQRQMWAVVSALGAHVTHADVPPILASMQAALGAFDRASEALVVAAKDDLQAALEVSVPYLKMLGIVMGGWQLARAACAVLEWPGKLADSNEFARAKLRTTRDYAQHVLPSAISLGYTVQSVLAPSIVGSPVPSHA